MPERNYLFGDNRNSMIKRRMKTMNPKIILHVISFVNFVVNLKISQIKQKKI